MNHTAPLRTDKRRMAAVLALAVVVAGIVAVAFRGSWGALRDAALAAHFDGSAADLYPFAVDGLLIVAIIAAVLLRHDQGARRYCLGIIVGYTVASWSINYLHGLGRFSLDPTTHTRPGPPWYVVMLIAALLIGSIFLGSHLLVYVWRHVFPTAADLAGPEPAFQAAPPPDRDAPDVPEPPADVMAAARQAYRFSRLPGRKELSQQALVDQFGISKRKAAQVQSEVKAEECIPADAEAFARTVAEPSRNGQGTP